MNCGCYNKHNSGIICIVNCHCAHPPVINKSQMNPGTCYANYSSFYPVSQGSPVSAKGNTSITAASPTRSLFSTPGTAPPTPSTPSFLGRYSVGSGQKRNSEEQEGEEEEEAEPEDSVRLWEDGWKERYYRDKYGVSSDDDEFVQKVVSFYVWV